MQITCGICRHRGDADTFVPRTPDTYGPDLVCPKCECGVYVPATLAVEDLFTVEVADEAV